MNILPKGFYLLQTDLRRKVRYKKHFMLAFLMDNQDMENTLRHFHWLEDLLGLDLFRELFPIILTDNGFEFKDPVSLEEPLESDDGLKRTRIFYCDPGKAYQKGGIEKNHEAYSIYSL
jgi:IS30 family transposase